MLEREDVIKILEQAHRMDKNCEMFGAEHHRYVLNPPVPEAFVRDVEEKCGFTLPADYRRFITQVGDGGAGPDYGIRPFREFWQWGAPPQNAASPAFAERCRQSYHRSLARPFALRPMLPEEKAEYYATGNPSHYREHPEQYFVLELPEEEDDDHWSTDGFLELGTRGCQWDYGMGLNGEHQGQVFTTDNEGGYLLEACCFDAFYCHWLDRLSDTEGFRRSLEQWKSHFRQKK